MEGGVEERDRFEPLCRATKSSPTALSRWPIQFHVAIHSVRLRFTLFKEHKRRCAKLPNMWPGV